MSKLDRKLRVSPLVKVDRSPRRIALRMTVHMSLVLVAATPN